MLKYAFLEILVPVTWESFMNHLLKIVNNIFIFSKIFCQQSFQTLKVAFLYDHSALCDFGKILKDLFLFNDAFD